MSNRNQSYNAQKDAQQNVICLENLGSCQDEVVDLNQCMFEQNN